MTYQYQFSKRTDWELYPNQLTSDLDRLKSDGKSIIDLTVSNPSRCGLNYPYSELFAALSNEKNKNYNPDSRGVLSARQEIAKYYKERGFDVDPQRIFLTASTSEAYAFLFRLLTNPTDQVLFPKPSYPLFPFLVDLNDLELEFYSLKYSDRWSIDHNNLLENVTSQSRAVVIVNPNNPTGSYVSSEELAKLNKVCLDNDMAIISDEVFWDFCFSKSIKRSSCVGNDQVLSFTLGGLSKTLGLPQMKLSWIVINGPDDVVNQAMERLEVISDTYLSVNTPVQNALPEWMTLCSDIQEQILSRIRSNRDFILNECDNVPNCQILNSDGGWYVVMRIPDTLSEEHWALKLLNNYHLYVHPGYFFDFDDEPFLILSLLPEIDSFQEGIKRLLSRMAQEQS